MRKAKFLFIIAACLSAPIVIPACGSSEPRTPPSPLWAEGFAADREAAKEAVAVQPVASTQGEWVALQPTDTVEETVVASTQEAADPYADGWVQDGTTTISAEGKLITKLPPPIYSPASPSETVTQQVGEVDPSREHMDSLVQSEISRSASMAIGESIPIATRTIQISDPAVSMPVAQVNPPAAGIAATPDDIAWAVREFDGLNVVLDATCAKVQLSEEDLKKLTREAARLKVDIEERERHAVRLEHRIQVVADDLDGTKQVIAGLTMKADADAKRITELETQVVALQQRPAAAPSVSVSAAPAAVTLTPAAMVLQAWEQGRFAGARNCLRAWRLRQPELSSDDLLGILLSSSDNEGFKTWVSTTLVSN